MTDPKDLLARALVELRSLRQRLAEAQRAAREPIAVVGVGCRYPGDVHGPDDLWRLLSDARDVTGELPPGRWPEHTGPDPDGMYTRRGGWLADVAGFDARFFAVSEKEARSLDPQHRLALEVCWEALEHAAIAPDRLRRTRTGVFFGVSTSDYAHLLAAHTELADVDGYFGPGTALSFAPGRVAYFLGLQGPSLAIDTACSSSLVAVHLACASLRARESDTALAGGVNLILSPAGHLVLCRGRVLSPAGRCATFDAAADGYARGEGCGVVVLRRLADARRDGDRVLAVIVGSAVNQDGPASGLTVPNPAAQESVVRDALAFAGRDPADLAYVEAHGTGTPLGDPIEARALAAVVGPTRARPLLLGTIKTNLGHLEAAAGITGLIKTVLALEHAELPRSLHFRRPNPAIAWDRLPLAVVDTHRPWPAGPRLAGVSSFGASGTNAHVLLVPHDDPTITAPAQTITTPAPTITTPTIPPTITTPAQPELLLLSAHTPAALRALAARHAADLTARPDLTLADRCHTAAVGRARLPHVLAVLADVPGPLREALEHVARDDLAAAGRAAPTILARRPRDVPRIVFLCSGQGAQQPAMGKDLFDEHPPFRDALVRCDELLRPHLPRPLISALYGPDPAPLDDTAWTQPALFAFEWSLASLWRAWGVEPAAVIGHSLGEYVAATLAGVLRLEDALPLIARRARLMQALPGGAMASIPVGEPDALAVLADHPAVVLAAINGPRDVVVSGDATAVDAALAAFAARGAHGRRLRVSHAFHSPAMDPILPAFARDLAALTLSPPNIPLAANLTGDIATDELTDPTYWRRHLRAPVRFADGLASLRARGFDLFLEIGPATALTALGARNDPAAAWLPSLRPPRPARASLLTALATLATRGLDLAAVPTASPPRRVALPTYPFQRQPHWLAARSSAPTTRPLPLIGHPLADGRTFAIDLRADGPAHLRDHTVYGELVVSGTVHAAMAIAAMQATTGAPGPFTLTDLEFLAPLVLPRGAPHRVHTRLTPTATGARFELLGPDLATLYTRGHLHPADAGDPPPPRDLADIRSRCLDHHAGPAFYDRFWHPDHHALGPSFRTITELWRRDGEVLARLHLPPPDPAADLDPAARLALCLGEVHGQLLMPALPDFEATISALADTFLGRGIACSRVHGPPDRVAWAHATLRGFDGDELIGDVALLDIDGHVLATVDGLRARKVPRALLRRALTRRLPPPAERRADVHEGPPEGLPRRVQHHLLTQLAAHVGGAPDFDPETRLSDLGVDSLMAVDLDTALRRDLGVGLDLTAALHGATLTQLAAHLTAALTNLPQEPADLSQEPAAHTPARPAHNLSQEPASYTAPEPPASAWLRPIGRQPTRPRLRLFCFPHSGGGSTAFHPWRGRLPADLAADVVQLPGRWERQGEPAFTRMDALLDALLPALADELVPPFALFGASMGALVAHALTCALHRAGRPLPVHLIVAAYPAPHLPNPLDRHRDVLRGALQDTPDGRAALRRLADIPGPLHDDATLRRLLPALRADFELVLAQPPASGPPLPVPITALGGLEDPEVARDQLAAWLAHTTADFAVRMLPGGHLFFRTHPDALLQALAAALR